MRWNPCQLSGSFGVDGARVFGNASECIIDGTSRNFEPSFLRVVYFRSAKLYVQSAKEVHNYTFKVQKCIFEVQKYTFEVSKYKSILPKYKSILSQLYFKNTKVHF